VRSKGEFVGVVDFGSREVRVLVARKDADGAIQVVGHGVAAGRGCVSQGVIQDLSAAQVAFHHAVTAAEKEGRVKITSLFCGINGRNVETFIREGKVKLAHEIVEHGHMKEALDQASRDILAPGKHITSSITSREWYVDDLRVIDPIDIRGQVLKVRVHFARLPAVIADNLTSCIESQHRDLEDLVFLPLASALGCLTPEDMDLGVAVLDMGYSTTGLAVYREHRIFGTHCFEWGGNHITRDVAAGLQVSFEEADELIAQYGISEERIRAEAREENGAEDMFPRKNYNVRIKLRCAVRGAPPVVERSQLDEIIYERAKELLTKVRQHLRARGLIDHLVRGVVLTGGVSRLGNQAALAEAVFQVPCRVGLPDSVEILPHAANAPEFSAAVGLVRHAFAYRAALRAGRIEGRGPGGSRFRRLGHAFRKYFF
jgi:cell division protein FtsA